MRYDEQISFIKSKQITRYIREACSFCEESSWHESVTRKILCCLRKIGRRKIVNVLLESDRRCPPTSASDYPGSKREMVDEAAHAVPPRARNTVRCPPRRGRASNTKTTEEEQEEEQETPVASAADRTRNSTDGPQGRRPNPRTTPQLLATKVSSSCTHAHAQVLSTLKFFFFFTLKKIKSDQSFSPTGAAYPSGGPSSKDARLSLARLNIQ